MVLFPYLSQFLGLINRKNYIFRSYVLLREKMAELKLNIPEDLYEKMKKHPEIKWDSVAQSALKRYIERIEIVEKIASKSKLTLDDVEEISNKVTKESWEKHKAYLNILEK